MKRRFEDAVECCLQSESAFCTAACPFHMDVRDFMEKIRRGAFGAAFKTYRNAVAFPRVVSSLCDQPCRDVCPRKQTDAALNMVLLEKAAIDFAGCTAPNRYAIPKKNANIAIVGAGAGGLACALRLATRRYDVTVFEKSGRIGGRLWDILPSELFLPDIEEQFTHETYKREMNTEIRRLDELAGFDAVYIATGANGEFFGLTRDTGGAFASNKPGIFLGGALTGSDRVSSIADGLHAVHAIERYLKTGAMNHPRENPTAHIKLDSSALSPMSPVIPAECGGYTREEAAAESARCLRCACDACLRRCDLMEYYKKRPKRIRDEVAITIDPASLDGEETFAKRLIATCNQCGACGESCPQSIDVGAFLLDSRRAMHRKGKLPWAFHDFWLKDMLHAQGEQSALAEMPGGFTKAEYAFFPGCQLGASDPDYVLESYRWLLSVLPGSALWLSCCGAPAVWSGDEELSSEVFGVLRKQWEALGKPVPVFACPTCKQMFERYMPEINKGVFLFGLMRQKEFVPRRDMGGAEYCVFDPCTSRNEQELHDAARTLAIGAGTRLSPLPDEGRRAKCCSWGGHVSIANPHYAKTVVKKRINQSERPYITYCVNCRDIFASEGKESVHLLDILFDINDGNRPSPGCNERRKNRAKLKRRALTEFFEREFMEDTDAREKENDRIILRINEELRGKLAGDMVLEDDVRETIAHCEATGRTIMDEAAGSLHGYALIGRITCWVEYRRLAKGEYLLLNAYCHRMTIDFEETWHGQKAKTGL